MRDMYIVTEIDRTDQTEKNSHIYAEIFCTKKECECKV